MLLPILPFEDNCMYSQDHIKRDTLEFGPFLSQAS